MEKAMNTKSFVDQLNQITDTLLAMTPAKERLFTAQFRQRRRKLLSMSCFSPSLIIYLNVLIATPHILKNGVEPVKHKDIIAKIAKRPLIIRQKHL